MAGGKFNMVQSLTILLNSYSKYLNVTLTSPLSSISIIAYVGLGFPILGFPTLPTLINNLFPYFFAQGICVWAHTKTSSSY